MKKYILIVCCILLSINFSIAQNSGEMKEVYLKDGSFLRGEVIEEVEGSHLDLKISGDNIVRFEASEILRIDTRKSNVTYFQNGKKFSNKGFHGALKMGGSFANNNYYAGFGSSIFFDLLGEYQFNKKISMGLGSSFDANEFGLLSVYGNVKFIPLVRRISPYLAASFGLGTIVKLFSEDDNSDYEGGIVFYPRIGLQFASRSSASFFTEVGYRIQHVERAYRWSETKDDIVYRRIAVSIGLNF